MTYPYPAFDGTQKCAGRNDFLFDAEDYEGWSRRQREVHQASLKSLCAECPWQLPCLDYGLHVREFGVWGGKNAIERTRMRNKLGIVAEEPQVFGATYLTEGHLNEVDVLNIRSLARSGRSITSIGQEFKRSRRSIQRIVNRHAFAEVSS